mmetsp:Transcript_22580/g.77198  ORF Transcript_22580/g.77198 Transcript_22580/m.77198 type:complete len:181 (+) Transcript_22580:118-660(+)
MAGARRPLRRKCSGRGICRGVAGVAASAVLVACCRFAAPSPSFCSSVLPSRAGPASRLGARWLSSGLGRSSASRAQLAAAKRVAAAASEDSWEDEGDGDARSGGREGIRYASDAMPEVTGSVRLFSTHTLCISCLACCCQFKRLLPNVKLEVAFDPWRETRRWVSNPEDELNRADSRFSK